MLEKDVQSLIIKYLAIKGIYCWVNKTQGTFDPKKKVFRSNGTTKGVSDILGILPNGRFLAIEVKRPGIKKGSPAQERFLLEIRRNGGIGIVADSLMMVLSNVDIFPENGYKG